MKTLKIERKVSIYQYQWNSRTEEHNEYFQRDKKNSKCATLKCFCHVVKYSGHEKRETPEVLQNNCRRHYKKVMLETQL